MSSFSEIRSIMNMSCWESTDFNRLRKLCHDLRMNDPVLWMSQVAPYVVSFQNHWNTYFNPTNRIDSILNDIPCVRFHREIKFPNLTDRRYNQHVWKYVKSLLVEDLYEASSSRMPKSYIFPDLTHLEIIGPQLTYVTFNSLLECNPPQTPLKLTHLTVRDFHMNNQSLVLLAAHGYAETIEVLDISNNVDLNEITVEDFPNLRTLKASGTSIPEEITSLFICE